VGKDLTQGWSFEVRDPLTRANGPVGLVKTLEPRSNVDIFTNFVKK